MSEQQKCRHDRGVYWDNNDPQSVIVEGDKWIGKLASPECPYCPAPSEPKPVTKYDTEEAVRKMIVEAPAKECKHGVKAIRGSGDCVDCYDEQIGFMKPKPAEGEKVWCEHITYESNPNGHPIYRSIKEWTYFRGCFHDVSVWNFCPICGKERP